MSPAQKHRLGVALIVVSSLFLCAVGFAFERLVESELKARFDATLTVKASALATFTKQKEGQVTLDFLGLWMPEFGTEVKPEYFQIWLDGQQVLERSDSLGVEDLHRDPARAVRGGNSLPHFLDVELPDRRIGRQIQVDFVPQTLGGGSEELPGRLFVTVVVAKSREDLDRQLRRLRISIALLGLGFVGLAWGASGWRRGSGSRWEAANV